MAILLNVKDCDDGIKLESFIKKHFKYIARSNLYKLIRTGQIRINGCRAKSNTSLNTGDSIRFPPFIEMSSSFDIKKSTNIQKNKSFFNKKLDVIKDNILFEDDDTIAINKPSGLASQGGSGIYCSLDRLMNLINDENYFRLVHRLDKETSGVMIFAKNLKMAQILTNAFKCKQVEKTYLAVCYGIFENKSGVINNNIIDDGKNLSAVTKYKVLSEYGNYMSLVELQPETGRKHQLRIHLSQMGHAVVGDRLHSTFKKIKELYSDLNFNDNKNSFSTNILYLHSFNIKFKNMLYNINAPISGQFLNFLKSFFPLKDIKKYI